MRDRTHSIARSSRRCRASLGQLKEPNLFQDHRTSEATGRLITQQRLEGVAEVSLQFEPNAGSCRRLSEAIDDCHIITVTAKWLETKRVYLGAPEAEGRCDMQTEEMTTVRPKCSPRPAARFEHFDNLKVAGKPIAVDGIEQEDVPVSPQARIAVEELGLRRREQRFSRRNRTRVARGDGAEGFEIERVTNVLKPPEPQGASMSAASMLLVGV